MSQIRSRFTDKDNMPNMDSELKISVGLGKAVLIEIERLEKALHEIADDRTVHTKENQVRLCCKYQDIASKALGEL